MRENKYYYYYYYYYYYVLYGEKLLIHGGLEQYIQKSYLHIHELLFA